MPVVFRAIVAGILVGLVAANVWPLFLLHLRVPMAATAEIVFLALYIWWSSGGGPPARTGLARRLSFRNTTLTPKQWVWGMVGALSFAVSVHAAIVLLFRFVPFPTEAFRRGYDFSFIPSQSFRWIAVVMSAISAGVCEETGFRGYMQKPIEQRHGAVTAILVSTFFFTVVHLTKAWSMLGMIPIVFGAGILLGLLAWSSQSLIPSIIGHIVMDIGLFAYWWTGIAGDFTSRPISETGVDQPFLMAGLVLVIALVLVLLAIRRLSRIRVAATVDA